MSCNINWREIFDKYEVCPDAVAQDFHKEHHIDWSKFDSSIKGNGEPFVEAFAKQQGWKYGWLNDDETRVVEHIIVADVDAPEEAVFGIADEEHEFWDSLDSHHTEYHLQKAILNHPHASERILDTMCLGLLRILKYGGTNDDMHILKYVFEHSFLSKSTLDEVAKRVYADCVSYYDAYRIMEYAPEYLLDRMFDILSKQPCNWGHSDLADIVDAPNASHELVGRVSEYMLAMDREVMKSQAFYNYEAVYDTIDRLLASPKISGEIKDKLQELREDV